LTAAADALVLGYDINERRVPPACRCGPPTAAEIQQIADTLNSFWWTSGDATSAPTLLRRVARALNRIDWSQVIPASEDFVVVAMDFYVLDLENDIRGSLGAERAAHALAES
jgi:hypothetical protein